MAADCHKSEFAQCVRARERESRSVGVHPRRDAIASINRVSEIPLNSIHSSLSTQPLHKISFTFHSSEISLTDNLFQQPSPNYYKIPRSNKLKDTLKDQRSEATPMAMHTRAFRANVEVARAHNQKACRNRELASAPSRGCAAIPCFSRNHQQQQRRRRRQRWQWSDCSAAPRC